MCVCVCVLFCFCFPLVFFFLKDEKCPLKKRHNKKKKKKNQSPNLLTDVKGLTHYWNIIVTSKEGWTYNKNFGCLFCFGLNDRPKETRWQPIWAWWFARTTLPASTASWHKASFYKLLRFSENIISKTMYMSWFKFHQHVVQIRIK